ncbi:MAG TPA: hypothetical protein VMT63_13350 [Bacteroidales bacterium]|nr:hypothetical protein [Bacteroidales bacterium]
MDELVFALPAEDLWQLIPFKAKGFIEASDDMLDHMVQKGLFHPRHELEDDPAFKQLISYGLLSCSDSFFLFRRNEGQREKRLHNHYTLGAGGHMNPADIPVKGKEYLLSELKRELFEELSFDVSCTIERIYFAGFLNDDLIEVGRQHIGLLYYVRLSEKNISILETEKLSGFWVDKNQLNEYYDAMETWSQFVVDCCINK